MPRALLSVSDKTGLVPFARALASRGFELVSTGGTARTLEQAGVPVIATFPAVTGFPGDHGRPGQDPAPGGPRRPSSPAAAVPTTWRRCSTHHITPDRSCRRQPVPVCEGGREAGHLVRRAPRGDRHRRPEHGALGREEVSRMCSWSVDPADYDQVIVRARTARRAVAGVSLRAGAEGLRPHGRVRRGYRRDARRSSVSNRPGAHAVCAIERVARSRHLSSL